SSLGIARILDDMFLDVKIPGRYSLDLEILCIEREEPRMEPHDLHSLNLAVDDRLESLRRSMARQRASERRTRRRVGDAFVALGRRIAGEQASTPQLDRG